MSSRSRFPCALAAVCLVVVGAVFAGCGGSSDRSGQSPQAVLDEATLQGIRSGELELSLGVKAQGAEDGELDISLSGPFQGEGKSGVPRVDMTAKAKGRIGGDDIDFEGGVVLLPDSAYVNYEGTAYKFDPTNFVLLESVLNPLELKNGVATETNSAAACEKEVGELKIADFVEEGVNEGSADVGGTHTTKISGDLDVPSAVNAGLGAAESSACRTQLSATGPFPSKPEIDKAKDDVGSAIQSAHVAVYVGDDDIVRQVSVRLKLEPGNGGGGPQRIETDLDLKLSGVNEEQELSAPQNAKPLSKLIQKLGLNPIELLSILRGEGGESLGDLLEGLVAY